MDPKLAKTPGRIKTLPESIQSDEHEIADYSLAEK
jgi:hypothetical protein